MTDPSKILTWSKKHIFACVGQRAQRKNGSIRLSCPHLYLEVHFECPIFVGAAGSSSNFGQFGQTTAQPGGKKTSSPTSELLS